MGWEWRSASPSPPASSPPWRRHWGAASTSTTTTASRRPRPATRYRTPNRSPGARSSARTRGVPGAGLRLNGSDVPSALHDPEPARDVRTVGVGRAGGGGGARGGGGRGGGGGGAGAVEVAEGGGLVHEDHAGHVLGQSDAGVEGGVAHRVDDL